MSTVQEYNTKSQQLTNTVNAVNDDLSSWEATAKSIIANPNQPDAQNKLDLAKELYETQKGADFGNLTGQTFYLSSAYNGLPPSDQQQVGDSYIQSTQSVIALRNNAKNIEASFAAAQAAIDSGEGTNNNKSGTGEDVKQDDDSTGTSSSQPEAAGFSTRPRKNPLGNFASYTYQLTLYMITPDAYDAFVSSGRKNINALRDAKPAGDNSQVTGGAFIIAQSGGANAQDRLQSEFKYDYYIDKLSFNTKISGDSEMNNVTFSFTITEPYGFSFISNLRRASERLNSLTKGKVVFDVLGAKQFFILGIRFYGYDQNGQLLTGKETLDSSVLDPNNSENGLFERFFDITISALKFKIDGRATTYAINATGVTQMEGLATKRGTLKQGFSYSASTVEEAINQLIEKMNQVEKSSVTSEPRNTFSVKFIGDEKDVEKLKNASLDSPNDNLKGAWGTSNAKNTSQVNENTSVKSSPNPVKKEGSENQGTIVNDVIAKIIKKSTYMTNAMNTLYDAQQFGSAGQPQTNNRGTDPLNWYNLSCELSNAQFNKTLNDWTYNITYVIQPYKTPAVYTPFISTTHDFYGPHKTYEYNFTGKNSEIISYEQNYDNNFQMVVLNDGALTEGISNAEMSAPYVPGKRPDVNRTGSFNQGLDAQNQVLTALYDPTAQVKSKLVILGDPDYLMSANPSSLNQVYDQFYGADGYTINPNGGQVFITVDFKEAIDYDVSNGYLSINEDILFFKYPSSIRNSIKGVIFQLTNCTSVFENGKFTQTLTVAVPPFWDETSTISTFSRLDAEKETAQNASAAADVRTSTTKANSPAPATEGAQPGNSDSSKQNSQLRPEPPPPVVGPELFDPQTGRSLGYADTEFYSSGDD